MQGTNSVSFRRIHTRISSKTKSWEVLQKVLSAPSRIGYISWYDNRNAYVFMPDVIRPYDYQVLGSIASFLKDVMIEEFQGTPNSRDFTS